jgi:hypothetical protein
MEELRMNVTLLKLEISRLKTIVDELVHLIVINNPAQENTETLIRKSQNTLKLLDEFCHR